MITSRVDEGHIVIEQHIDLAAEADHIIDIGPEASPNDGTIVAQDIPEEVAKSKVSVTAPFIKPALHSTTS